MEQNETYVPGMVGKNRASEENANAKCVAEAAVAGEDKRIVSTKPIVGFLYSISSGVAEYWPLYVGANIIGRSAKCDIVLNEKTVSNEHASIIVRKMRTTGKVVASVKDLGSDVGMFLNDEELDFESHTCKNEDIILIGSNYKFVLLLIDAEKYGLSVAKDFMRSTGVVENTQPQEEVSEPEYKPAFTAHNPYRKMVADDTIALNGGSNFNNAPTTSLLDTSKK